MSLPPIFYHYFSLPLPYARTLALQERIHKIQLTHRRFSPSKHKDVLLLLQHRPVFTAGRRQTEEETQADRIRLTHMGADFESTQRGGQLTYHGPGQIVGYPLIDLGRPAISVRDYVCQLQRTLQTYLHDAHGIKHAPSEHTGVFVDDGHTKLGSIGVQVRHRLTTHGVALNITREPLPWFDTVVACGLTDVRAGCVAGRSEKVDELGLDVDGEIPGLVRAFSHELGRDIEQLYVDREPEIGEAIMEMDELARRMGTWQRAPSPVAIS